MYFVEVIPSENASDRQDVVAGAFMLLLVELKIVVCCISQRVFLSLWMNVSQVTFELL